MAVGTKEQKYRGSLRREHRMLGAYLMLQAWKNGADCLSVDREAILTFLGLQRWKGARAEWFEEDIEPYFSHIESLVRGPSEKFAGVFMSRVSLNGVFPSGRMSDAIRARKLTDAGVRTEVVRKLPDQETICKELAFLVAGL